MLSSALLTTILNHLCKTVKKVIFKCIFDTDANFKRNSYTFFTCDTNRYAYLLIKYLDPSLFNSN